MIKEHLELLGMPVRDRVTTFAGVVSSVTFDLYGCVQGYVVPVADKDGKLSDGCWFDTKRLEATGTRVMPLPATVLAVVPLQAPQSLLQRIFGGPSHTTVFNSSGGGQALPAPAKPARPT